VFCFSAAYVTAERNLKVDLAYFRSARAGSATKKLVAALDQPVQVYLFFRRPTKSPSWWRATSPI